MISNTAINALGNFLNTNGQNVRLRYYTTSYSGNSYDTNYLSASGANIWVKGYLGRITKSDASQLMDAGKINYADGKLYIPGSLATEPDVWTKFGIGSPTPVEYSMLEQGIIIPNIGSSAIYRGIFVRKLNTGSFSNEV